VAQETLYARADALSTRGPATSTLANQQRLFIAKLYEARKAMDARKWESAVALASDAVKLDAHNPAALLLLADALEGSGHSADAAAARRAAAASVLQSRDPE
ncbi:MAG: hypothetical protein ACREQB_09635, partial [Candidatus Binataceae bacterium]